MPEPGEGLDEEGECVYFTYGGCGTSTTNVWRSKVECESGEEKIRTGRRAGFIFTPVCMDGIKKARQVEEERLTGTCFSFKNFVDLISKCFNISRKRMAIEQQKAKGGKGSSLGSSLDVNVERVAIAGDEVGNGEM